MNYSNPYFSYTLDLNVAAGLTVYARSWSKSTWINFSMRHINRKSITSSNYYYSQIAIL